MSSPENIQEKVTQSLNGTPHEVSELLRLDGGFANFTYRGVLAIPNGYSTIIIKHAEPYVALNSNFPLDTVRILYENLMLSAASSINFNEDRSSANVPTVKVTSPEPYAYFQESSTLVLQDFPFSTTLKAYFRRQANIDSSRNASFPSFRDMGIALGSALRKLHSWGATARDVEEAPQELIRKKLRSNEMPKNIKFRLNYSRLLDTIHRFPAIEPSREIFDLVQKKMYAEIIEGGTEEFQIIHGDFWSGNILVTEPQGNKQDSNNSSALQLTIIDWEFAQLGHPSCDVGQMLAELYLLVFFAKSSGAKECMEGFIDVYKERNEAMDSQMQYRIAIQMGAHFLGITSRMSEWTEGMEDGSKAMETLVQFGADLVTHGWSGLNNPHAEEDQWFRFGPLYAVFFPSLDPT